MKLLLLLGFLSANVFASDSSQFPSQSGPFIKDVYVKGLHVRVKADFKINKGVEFGLAYTSHTYQNPEFYVEGKKVSVNRLSAREIFNSMGYEGLSYVVNTQVGLFDRGLLLDENLRVRRMNHKEIVLQENTPIGAYHPVCADWQY